MSDWIAELAWILIPAVAVAAVGWLLMRLWRRQMPYERRPALVTRAELRFYRALIRAVDEQWTVFAMVRLADLIRVRSATPKFRAWQNRIHAKHIDFVLCDPISLEVRLAVELDDATHARADRQRRDRFVESALASADIPLLRIPVGSVYRTRTLRRLIQSQVGR